MAMKELQALLSQHEMAVTVNFDHLNHRVRCYAHIVNICVSHIISTMSRNSRPHSCVSSDDESDCDDTLPGCDEQDLDEFAGWSSNRQSHKVWVDGLKRKPLEHARKVIRVLRSLNKFRTEFKTFVNDGNKHGWFFSKDEDGTRTTVNVKYKELLRDVRTRWDSVYLMLARLQHLRPVRFLTAYLTSRN